jgi:hypothetical protein
MRVIFMPEFGVWTTLYSVMFAVFAIGWGFWLGIIAIVVNLTNLLIFSSDMFKYHLKECEFRFNNRKQNLYKFLLGNFRKEPLN